jgi:hypothetical protein
MTSHEVINAMLFENFRIQAPENDSSNSCWDTETKYLILHCIPHMIRKLKC